MSSDSIHSRLTAVFRDVFDNRTLVISPATTAKDVEGWDSYAHVNLIVAIEETFGVAFTTREIGSFSCVGDVIDLLRHKGIEEPSTT
jgi:acyl carrier protein